VVSPQGTQPTNSVKVTLTYSGRRMSETFTDLSGDSPSPVSGGEPTRLPLRVTDRPSKPPQSLLKSLDSAGPGNSSVRTYNFVRFEESQVTRLPEW
jgi:hypothetical protein